MTLSAPVQPGAPAGIEKRPSLALCAELLLSDCKPLWQPLFKMASPGQFMWGSYDVAPGGDELVLVQVDETTEARRIDIVMNWFKAGGPR